MDAGQRPRGNPVPVLVEVAVKGRQLFQRLGVEDLTAVGPVLRIPLELLAHPVVHPDIEIGEHDDWRLQHIG